MNQNTFYELVTKVLSGEATQEEKKLFDVYMLDDEYSNLYKRLKNEWHKEIKHPEGKFQYTRGLEKLRNKIKSTEKPQQHQPLLKVIRERGVLYVAATLTLVLVFGFLAKNMLLKTNPDGPIQLLSFETQRGEKKIIALPDGSKIHMNADTKIQYPADFSDTERSVNLTGEAFFLVKKDVRRPFRVHSGDVMTTVLGTSFNVSAFPENDALITVVSGKVNVFNQLDSTAVTLTKGEQALYRKSVGGISKTEVDVNPYTGWRNGILHFEGITLKKAIEQMERWYNVSIECQSSGLLQRNIRGVYEKEPLQKVLDDMQFMLDLKYEFVNDSVVVIMQ